MRSLRQILGLGRSAQEDARDTATVLRIARELEELPAQQARFLAAFAYVLARVARADLDVSESETRTMVGLVQDYGELPGPQASLVVTLARTLATTFGGTENYVVTRQFRELSTRAQRIDLMRCLFAVAAADEGVSAVEDAEITQIGSELGFERSEIAGLRAAFRARSAEPKGPSSPATPGGTPAPVSEEE